MSEVRNLQSACVNDNIHYLSDFTIKEYWGGYEITEENMIIIFNVYREFIKRCVYGGLPGWMISNIIYYAKERGVLTHMIRYHYKTNGRTQYYDEFIKRGLSLDRVIIEEPTWDESSLNYFSTLIRASDN